MKKLTALLLTTVLLAGALSVGTQASQTSQPAVPVTVGNIITTTGEGNIYVKPDIAIVNCGVTTEDKDPKKALDDNNTSMRKVIDTIKSLGIADKDIRTTNYSIYPNYDYNSNTRKLNGYRVENSITVTLRDITQVGTVIGKAVEAGANIGNGVNFSISDTSKFYDEAMTAAVKNATEKANTLAAAIGKKVSAVVEIVEGNRSGQYYQTKQMSAAADMIYNSAVPIQTGELTVSAYVTVTFRY